MSKVKINANYPENPGLLEGKYWVFVDNKLDFMDDTNMFPTKAQLRFKPSELGLSDMEDIATKQRAARDAYLKDSADLFYVHLRNFRMTGDAYPKVFSNRSIDLALPSYVDGSYQESPAHEMTRFIFPSQVDGSNNWPAVHIEGAEMYHWDNPSIPKKAVKLLSKVDNWSIESLINRLDFQSGGDAGSGINLPVSLAMSNPFLGATISWIDPWNDHQEYVWGSDWKQQFFSMVPDNEVDANGMHNGSVSYVEDGSGILLNYQDMHSFYRAVKDEFLKTGNEIALARTSSRETHNIDGDDAKLNAAIAATGLTAKQAELSLVQEQIDSLNLELTALINDSADQAEIAAKEAEINAKNEEVNLVTNELNALISSTEYLIMFLTKQNGMMKAYSLMKTWILSNPLPNIDMAKCTINGVVSPVLKNAFANSYMMTALVNNNLITTQQLQQLQENPVTPLEYFGEINLNFVPAVKYVAELKGVDGQIGDMIFVEEIGGDMAFDGVNWTEKQYNIFDYNMLSSARGAQDAKFKAFNEISLAMRPFLWANHHIPAYMITENNEIRTELDRTVFDFTSVNGTTP